MMAMAWVMAVLVAALNGMATSAQALPISVDVQLGPAVSVRSDEIGRSDLQQQADYLQSSVQRALGRSSIPPSRVVLTITDIEPNRPTSAQLGASTQLSESSFGVGGASIVGEVTAADGARSPIRFRFFQDQIRDETNFSTWGDADEAFDELARLIASGKAPNDQHAWPPVHRTRAVTGTRIPGSF